MLTHPLNHQQGNPKSSAGLPTLAVPIVAGLDQRFGWSSQMVPLIHLAGLTLFALGQGLFSWAMVSNKRASRAKACRPG